MRQTIPDFERALWPRSQSRTSVVWLTAHSHNDSGYKETLDNLRPSPSDELDYLIRKGAASAGLDGAAGGVAAAVAVPARRPVPRAI